MMRYDRDTFLQFFQALGIKRRHFRAVGNAAGRNLGYLTPEEVWPQCVAAADMGLAPCVCICDTPTGKQDSFIQAEHIFVDLDDATLAVIGKEAETTLIVETRPGRYHVYWRLTEPTSDAERWRHCMRQLASRYGGDAAIVDTARHMRIPGFSVSWKGVTSRPRIVAANPAYSLELPEFQATPPSTESVSDIAARVAAVGGRDNYLTAMGYRLANQNITRDEARILLSNTYEQVKSLGPADLTIEIALSKYDTARKKLAELIEIEERDAGVSTCPLLGFGPELATKLPPALRAWAEYFLESPGRVRSEQSAAQQALVYWSFVASATHISTNNEKPTLGLYWMNVGPTKSGKTAIAERIIAGLEDTGFASYVMSEATGSTALFDGLSRRGGVGLLYLDDMQGAVPILTGRSRYATGSVNYPDLFQLLRQLYSKRILFPKERVAQTPGQTVERHAIEYPALTVLATAIPEPIFDPSARELWDRGDFNRFLFYSPQHRPSLWSSPKLDRNPEDDEVQRGMIDHRSLRKQNIAPSLTVSMSRRATTRVQEFAAHMEAQAQVIAGDLGRNIVTRADLAMDTIARICAVARTPAKHANVTNDDLDFAEYYVGTSLLIPLYWMAQRPAYIHDKKEIFGQIVDRLRHLTPEDVTKWIPKSRIVRGSTLDVQAVGLVLASMVGDGTLEERASSNGGSVRLTTRGMKKYVAL